jgi:hypothetical protein
MGYYVKSQPWKKSAPLWKVQFISFKRADTANSRAKKPKREWDIAKSRWPGLGFNAFMTLDEARVRECQIKRQEEQLKKLEEDQANIQQVPPPCSFHRQNPLQEIYRYHPL